MNLKPDTRKQFFKSRHGLALVIAAIFSAVGAVGLIVGISLNLASVDTPAPTAPFITGVIGQPLELSGELTPPPILKGRISAPKATAESLAIPFFDETGEKITLSALKGKGLVVNFWATWCAPCIKEMPALDTLAGQLEGSGTAVVAISVDRKAVPKVKAFYEEIGIRNLKIYYDERGILSRGLGVTGLPNTLLINADGVELGRVVGIAPWDETAVMAYIKRVLGPAP